MAIIAEATVEIFGVNPAADELTEGQGYSVGMTERFTGGGTTAGRADKGYAYEGRTISGSSTLSIDLQTQPMVNQGTDALNLAEVVLLLFHSRATNGGDIELTPNATNGWTGLLVDSSDKIVLPPGASLLVGCKSDPAFPVSATSKVLDVINTDASDATIDFLVVGRSA